MSITADQLRALHPTVRPERALLYGAALNDACRLGDLTTSLRIRHFVAQLAHESGGFRALVESTAYKDPQRLDELFLNVQGVDHAKRLIAAGPQAIGNTIYANKLGNGGVTSGDGFRYRGRGFIMLTGRSNYRKIGTLVGIDLESNPDQVGEPVIAANVAALFWKNRGINLAADADDLDAVTALVNGPRKLHLAERRSWLGKAKAIWV